MVFVGAQFRKHAKVNVFNKQKIKDYLLFANFKVLYNKLQFFPLLLDDAGTYECVAQNNLGSDVSRAMLIIPGDKRGYRV